MDSLSQIVLGASVGEAVLGKKVGNKAILWGAVAGTIPDLDVLSKYFVDQVTANELHRGFSHSILFCVLFAPIFGWIVWKLNRNESASFKDWTKLMFWGLFTHPILDSFTTWGTQLFWPHPVKISFKNIFVIDPLYTVPFAVFLILSMRQSRDSVKRRKYNKLALIVSSSYMLLTLILKGYSHWVFKSSIEQEKINYKSIQTKPTPLNSLLWTANIETEDQFLIGYFSILDKDRNIKYLSFDKNHQLIEKLKENKRIKQLINLSEGWYTIEEKESSLIFNDLRFGQAALNDSTANFVFAYQIKQQDKKIKVSQLQLEIKDAGAVFGPLFKRIFIKEN